MHSVIRILAEKMIKLRRLVTDTFTKIELGHGQLILIGKKNFFRCLPVSAFHKNFPLLR